MIENDKVDPLGMSNAKSHPEGELDSMGVTTYMYDENKSNKMFQRFIDTLIESKKITQVQINSRFKERRLS
jgi:hypothetical protein